MASIELTHVDQSNTESKINGAKLLNSYILSFGSSGKKDIACFKQAFWSYSVPLFPLVPLLDFSLLDSFGGSLEEMDQRVCWFAAPVFSLETSFLPSSQHVLYQHSCWVRRCLWQDSSPSQTCDEDSIKFTAFIPGWGQKGCLCGKAPFSRCKILDKWDSVLLELEPGMSKAFCAIVTCPCLKKRREIPLSHLALPCSPAGLSGNRKHRSQIHDPV